MGNATREAVAWLKAHSFVDVNVPVRVVLASKGGAQSTPVQRVVTDRELGVTPLMAACKCQCVDMVLSLLEQGAATHLVTANGDTALHFVWHEWVMSSTSSGTSAGMKALVERGIRAKSTLAVVSALIDHAADPNAQVPSTIAS